MLPLPQWIFSTCLNAFPAVLCRHLSLYSAFSKGVSAPHGWYFTSQLQSFALGVTLQSALNHT